MGLSDFFPSNGPSADEMYLDSPFPTMMTTTTTATTGDALQEQKLTMNDVRGWFKRNGKRQHSKRDVARHQNKERRDFILIAFYTILVLAGITVPAVLWPETTAHTSSVEMTLLLILLLATATPIVFLSTGGFATSTHSRKRVLFNTRFQIKGKSEIQAVQEGVSNAFSSNPPSGGGNIKQKEKKSDVEVLWDLLKPTTTDINEGQLKDAITTFHHKMATRYLAYGAFVSAWIIKIYTAVICIYSFYEHVFARNAITGIYLIDMSTDHFLWAPGSLDTEALLYTFMTFQLTILLGSAIWFYVFTGAHGDKNRLMKIARDTALLGLLFGISIVQVILGFMPDARTGVFCVVQAFIVGAFFLYFGFYASIVSDFMPGRDMAVPRWVPVLLELMRLKEAAGVLYVDAIVEIRSRMLLARNGESIDKSVADAAAEYGGYGYDDPEKDPARQPHERERGADWYQDSSFDTHGNSVFLRATTNDPIRRAAMNAV